MLLGASGGLGGVAADGEADAALRLGLVLSHSAEPNGPGADVVIFLTLWVIAIGFGVTHVSIARLWRHPLERDTLFLLYQLTVALGL